MRRAAGLLLGSLFMLTASAGHAADPNNSKEAARRFEEGKRLKAAGDCEHARLAFAQAAILVRTPASIWEAAKCEYQSGHYVEALNHARQLLHEPAADKIDVEQASTRMIPELAQKVGQVTIAAPDGAAIDVDKDYFGVAPLHDPIAVKPGHHKVSARTDVTTLTEEFDVTEGSIAKVTLGTPPTPGAAASTTPDDISSLLIRPATMNTEEHRDSTSKPESESTRYWVSGTLAGVAAVAVIGSVTSFLLANSSNSDVNAAQAAHPAGSCAPNGCADLDSALDARHSRAITAWVFTGVAGAAAIGAGVTWFALRPKPRSSTGSLELAPSLAPGHAGVLLQGSF